jgi:hypothetical protein
MQGKKRAIFPFILINLFQKKIIIINFANSTQLNNKLVFIK